MTQGPAFLSITARSAADCAQPNRWRVAAGRAGGLALTRDLSESPLAWLMRRGHISERQFAAGERLRDDLMLAGRPAATTMRWDAAPSAGGARGAPAALDPTLAQIAAKRRFEEAAASAGPGLSDILTRVICLGEGLEVAERALGWPTRAGKLVLAMALDRLAAHYRL